MTRKRKSFDSATEPVTRSDYREAPWIQIWAGTTVDFRRWLYVGWPMLDDSGQGRNLIDAGREEIVRALRDAVWHGVAADRTKASHCNGGIRSFLQYLDHLHATHRPVTCLAQIDSALLEGYIHWLRYTYVAGTATGRLSYSACANRYTQTIAPLRYLVTQRALPEGLFPRNPFPNVSRTKTPHAPYPKSVMKQLLRGLSRDIRGMRAGTLLQVPSSEALTVYLMAIAARCGRNTTPLLEAHHDALREHPVKPHDMRLLVLYKRRGNTISVQAFRQLEGVEDLVSLPMDAVTLFQEVATRTEAARGDAPPAEKHFLWLYRAAGGPSAGKVVRLTNKAVYDAARSIVERHQLIDEDGERLRLNISRLRATFNQRMWQLTGGDILKTAKLTGNTPQVNDRHYLAVTPDMEADHRRLGHLMQADLAGDLERPDAFAALSREVGIPVAQLRAIVSGDHNTGVGRCRDPLRGDRAPKNGSPCTRWLQCFRCPDQVVMESDLYRLFSFRRLVIAEQGFVPRPRWEQLYGQIVRILDEEIVAPNLRTADNPRGCFDPLRVQRMREHAERDPHPLWRDRALLALGAERNDLA